jgi:hypothetical protein
VNNWQPHRLVKCSSEQRAATRTGNRPATSKDTISMPRNTISCLTNIDFYDKLRKLSLILPCFIIYNKCIVIVNFLTSLKVVSGPGSSVDMTGYGMEAIEFRWGARFFAYVQTGPGAHPACSSMGTGSFPRVKRPGRGADHPPTPSG